MTSERLYLFDTTLRDGAQTIGTNFLLPDKLRIVSALDKLGLDYIEAGFPGSNPVDTELFETAPELRRARLTAFGMTKRVGYSISNDPGFQQVIRQARGQVCIVAKSSEYHVRLALGISNEENLSMISESLAAIQAAGHEAYLNCEHFFTGYLDDPAYGRAVVRTALESGARWITLCDTNGGTMPSEISRIVTEVCEIAPGDRLGIHAHNDTEQAVANTLAAVLAGCRLVHGTMNGLGERCGNANLTSLIPTLLLKDEYAERFHINVDLDDLRHLKEVSLLVDDVLGRAPFAQAPYVGSDAFATKAGLHASAIRKEPATYEHINPALVGNQRRIVVASQAGRSNILTALERLQIVAAAEDERIVSLVDQVKRAEADGYAFDLGPTSLDLRIASAFGKATRAALSPIEWTLAGRNAGNRHRLRLSLVTASDTGGPPDQIMVEGDEAFDLVQRAVLALYSMEGEVLARLTLTLIEQRTVDTGHTCLCRTVVKTADPETGQIWRTVGVGQSEVDSMLCAVDDALRYALEVELRSN